MTTTMKKRKQLPRSERPEVKAMNGELRSMSDKEILAVFLGSGVSGNNVKRIAGNLIRKFGENLLTATPKELCEIKGIGPAKAAKLAASFELYRKLSNDIARMPINSLEDTNWLLQDLAKEKQEVMGYIALGVRNRPIEGRFDLFKGTESNTVADPKQIFKSALKNNANSIIVYHNHPGGTKDFSKLDMEFPTEDDHPWHEVESVCDTAESPTVNVSAAYFRRLLCECHETGWEQYALGAEVN